MWTSCRTEHVRAPFGHPSTTHAQTQAPEAHQTEALIRLAAAEATAGGPRSFRAFFSFLPLCCCSNDGTTSSLSPETIALSLLSRRVPAASFCPPDLHGGLCLRDLAHSIRRNRSPGTRVRVLTTRSNVQARHPWLRARLTRSVHSQRQQPEDAGRPGRGVECTRATIETPIDSLASTRISIGSFGQCLPLGHRRVLPSYKHICGHITSYPCRTPCESSPRILRFLTRHLRHSSVSERAISATSAPCPPSLRPLIRPCTRPAIRPNLGCPYISRRDCARVVDGGAYRTH